MEKYFSVTKTDNVNVVTLLFSELSIEQAEEFKTHLYKLASDSENKFIIDIHKCDFLPSIALGVFVSFVTKVKEKKGEIVEMQNTIKRLRELTGS